jgi:hypothetical protein
MALQLVVGYKNKRSTSTWLVDIMECFLRHGANLCMKLSYLRSSSPEDERVLSLQEELKRGQNTWYHLLERPIDHLATLTRLEDRRGLA